LGQKGGAIESYRGDDLEDRFYKKQVHLGFSEGVICRVDLGDIDFKVLLPLKI
jgi:hypothetical protein